MPTPAYTELDSNKPDGSVGTGATFSADTLDQMRKLRDMAVTGRAKGFVQTRVQGTGPTVSRPQFIRWINATTLIGFEKQITWGGTGNYQPTTIQWSWSNDGGATWAVMGAAQVNTFDANDNITASTQSGGFVTILMEVWAKCLRVVADFATHVAAVGTAVHGLGSIATQSAAAVALTGGTTNGLTQGATTPGDLDATRVRERFNDYGAQANGATVNFEWDKYGHVAVTPHATTTSTLIIGFTGLPAAGRVQSILVEIINGQRSADAKITWPANAKWIGGAGTRPLDNTLELAGRNFFLVTTRDGGARLEIQHIGKGG